MAYYLFNFTRKSADKSKPLREQAANLLNLRLWGIGDKTGNRTALAAGDRILAYVGAPEQAFVGHATLSSGVHDWTADEVAKYPADWHAGVSFADATAWEHPVALASVWSEMPSSESNPGARFFGGVVRIKQADFERVLAERKEKVGVNPGTPEVAAASAQAVAPPTDKMVDKVFAATERLRTFLKKPLALTEEATRAQLIDRYLTALGYTEFEDVEYGVQVDSGDFADYVLRSNGDREVVLEAKKFGAVLGAKEAGQVAKYASVLGVRWGALTDGRYLKVYDPRIPKVAPENRLVFELDLAGYEDREDMEVRIYPYLALLAKDEIAGGGLERRAAKEAVRELLTDGGTQTTQALLKELKTTKLIQLDSDELTDLLAELLA